MKNSKLPSAQHKPESNQYCAGSGQFLGRTSILLTGYATALSTRTSLSLIPHTSTCGIRVRKLEHFSSAHELLKINQEDADVAVGLAQTGSLGKEHTVNSVVGVGCFPKDYL